MSMGNESGIEIRLEGDITLGELIDSMNDTKDRHPDWLELEARTSSGSPIHMKLYEPGQLKKLLPWT